MAGSSSCRFWRSMPPRAAAPALLVVIDDLTQALADIRKSVWSRLQGELLASLFSLLLLALLVHAPLQRMTQAVRAIPLLGRSAFAEARNANCAAHSGDWSMTRSTAWTRRRLPCRIGWKRWRATSRRILRRCRECCSGFPSSAISAGTCSTPRR
jgi:hypothetical protein